ncbi:zeta toxin family protein [Hungatella hathewayi]|uniref:zeta toxin family protein n=1 Tax=Hungatella hathewayi TaxID=154046 RepID=UPI003569FA31
MTNLMYTEKEYENSYKQIKGTLLNKKYKENYPLATLIGGQPGSGKSELTKYIKSQNDNTIAIDGDYIREFHPHLEYIVKEYGIDYPKVTQPFVNRAVEQLIDELSRDKYNLVIEGTLRDIDVPIKTARMLDERDYLVELYIIATNKELSWQSTIDRGGNMKDSGKIPRYVDKAHHDRITEILPETVRNLENEESIYNIVIMRRDQSIIYDKRETPDLDPKDILKRELAGEHVKDIDEIKQEREELEWEDKTSVKDLIEEAQEELLDEHMDPVLHIDKGYER